MHFYNFMKISYMTIRVSPVTLKNENFVVELRKKCFIVGNHIKKHNKKLVKFEMFTLLLTLIRQLPVNFFTIISK